MIRSKKLLFLSIYFINDQNKQNIRMNSFIQEFSGFTGTGFVLFRERAVDPKLDIGLCAINSGQGGRFLESSGWQSVLRQIHRLLLASCGSKPRWQDLPGALYSV
jgi:hypothetical protein